jgi:hypothetical protein
MKRSLLLVLGVMWVITRADLFAVERLYIDDKGYRHYSCGENMRGAKIEIKEIGRDRFRVRGSRFAGIMELPADKVENQWCSGLLGAVRILCGECKDPTSHGSVADKIRQLGLNRENE